MSQTQPKVVFLRGLNSWGDNCLHLGRKKIRFDVHIRPEFEKRGFEFYSVDSMRTGRLTEKANRAAEEILSHSRSGDELVLIGHSMGGLVAHQILNQPEIKKKTKAVISLGTPFKGSLMAEKAYSIGTDPSNVIDRLAAHVSKRLGYNFESRLDSYQDLRPSVREKEPIAVVDGPVSVSVCGVATLPQRSLQFRFLDESTLKLKWPISFLSSFEEGDGLVSLESQKFGRILNIYSLDHIGYLGFQFQIQRSEREKAKLEYLKMLSEIEQFLKSL
jgi:hypothetical protein